MIQPADTQIMQNAEFSYLWAVFVPGSIVLFSFLVTLWLYRVFSREHHADRERK